MIDEILSDLSGAGQKAHEALKRELTRIRTGRANPDLLSSLKIDYYGTPTPIQQMSNITVPEARMLMVKPFDKTMVKVVEKAIMEAGLGLNPQSDGELLRIPMPPLTEDRRKELAKIARAAGEDCKVAIRKARHDAKDLIDELQKSGDASEDECDRAKKKLEEIVKGLGTKTDEIVAAKEADIMEV
jgi:ribosome recycling factor